MISGGGRRGIGDGLRGGGLGIWSGYRGSDKGRGGGGAVTAGTRGRVVKGGERGGARVMMPGLIWGCITSLYK